MATMLCQTWQPLTITRVRPFTFTPMSLVSLICAASRSHPLIAAAAQPASMRCAWNLQRGECSTQAITVSPITTKISTLTASVASRETRSFSWGEHLSARCSMGTRARRHRRPCSRRRLPRLLHCRPRPHLHPPCHRLPRLRRRLRRLHLRRLIHRRRTWPL